LAVEAHYGVIWQDKYIGSDVCIYDGAIVLYQVTNIPDGFIIGAGSVLTRNPGPYEIWAGVPARKIGEREVADNEDIEKIIGREKFQLSHSLKSQGEKWF
jgi:acetyltransferase-like isoleucine patch superfamily enzyme